MFSTIPSTGTLSFWKAPDAAAGVAHGQQLGRGDHDAAGERHQLGHAELRIARARGKVDDEVVELSPGHVGQELPQRAVDHGAAPHQAHPRPR